MARQAHRFALKCTKLALALSITAALILAGNTPARAGGVVGDGTPGSCNWSALNSALSGGGLVTFNCGSNPHTILLSGELVVFGDQTATVDGGGLITLDGGDLLQIFDVVNGGGLHLRHITLTRGRSSSGGAILNELNSVTDLYDVVIENSTADGTTSGAGGGAIYSQGTLTITRSTLRHNVASRWGGAIVNGDGTLTVNESTLSDNSAAYAGAIYQGTVSGTTVLENTLLEGNAANGDGVVQGEGGAIYSFGHLNLTNVTFGANIADQGGGLFAANFSTNSLLNVTLNKNRADSGGGMFNNSSSSLQLKNTIVANSRDRADVSDSLQCDSNGAATTSLGYNVIGDGSCFAADVGDQTNTNPQLGPLADNGGPTLTYMPQAGSPAIDKGTNSGCPAVDQRGAHRPFGAKCDVGAVEYGAHPPSLWLPVVERS